MKYFKQLSHTGFIQMLYRLKPTQWNDGTVSDKLEYLSSFEAWQGSLHREKVMPELMPITEEEYTDIRKQRGSIN